MITGQISQVEPCLTGKISAEPTLIGKLIVSVMEVPYYEISNESGGSTVYIAREVIDNGSK